MKHCSKCKSIYEDSWSVCLKCNAQLEHYEAPPESPKSEPIVKDPTQCPYCKEDIKEGAIKCKHCGEILLSAFNSVYTSA